MYTREVLLATTLLHNFDYEILLSIARFCHLAVPCNTSAIFTSRFHVRQVETFNENCIMVKHLNFTSQVTHQHHKT